MKKKILFVFFLLLLICFNKVISAKEINNQDDYQSSSSNVVNLDGYQNVDESSICNIIPKNCQTNLCEVAEVGDLIFEGTGGYGVTHHIAIVESKIFDEEKNMFWIRVVEALPNVGIVYSVLDDYRFIEAKDKLLRSKDKLDIVRLHYFLDKQIGKNYSLTLDYNSSIDDSNWYCSELAWSSYLYAGVDFEIDPLMYVTPLEILNSTHLEEIEISDHNHNNCIFNVINDDYHHRHCLWCGESVIEGHRFINNREFSSCKDCGLTLYKNGHSHLGGHYETSI